MKFLKTFENTYTVDKPDLWNTLVDTPPVDGVIIKNHELDYYTFHTMGKHIGTYRKRDNKLATGIPYKHIAYIVGAEANLEPITSVITQYLSDTPIGSEHRFVEWLIQKYKNKALDTITIDAQVEWEMFQIEQENM